MPAATGVPRIPPSPFKRSSVPAWYNLGQQSISTERRHVANKPRDHDWHGQRDGSAVRELRRVGILGSLDHAALERLAAVALRRSYRRGATILQQGDDEDGIFAIVEGRVRLVRTSPNGREVTVASLAGGDVFGLSFLAAATPSRSALVAAETPTAVYRIADTAFRRLLSEHPGVGVAAVELVGRELATLAGRVEEMALHSSAARLAHTLLIMAEWEGDRLVVRRTHAEIAAWVGVRPEEVTKQIAALRAEGIVHAEPRRPGLIIVDRDELAGRAAEITSGM